jgi:hypothetical protein
VARLREVHRSLPWRGRRSVRSITRGCAWSGRTTR